MATEIYICRLDEINEVEVELYYQCADQLPGRVSANFT